MKNKTKCAAYLRPLLLVGMETGLFIFLSCFSMSATSDKKGCTFPDVGYSLSTRLADVNVKVIVGEVNSTTIKVSEVLRGKVEEKSFSIDFPLRMLQQDMVNIPGATAEPTPWYFRRALAFVNNGKAVFVADLDQHPEALKETLEIIKLDAVSDPEVKKKSLLAKLADSSYDIRDYATQQLLWMARKDASLAKELVQRIPPLSMDDDDSGRWADVVALRNPHLSSTTEVDYEVIRAQIMLLGSSCRDVRIDAIRHLYVEFTDPKIKDDIHKLPEKVAQKATELLTALANKDWGADRDSLDKCNKLLQLFSQSKSN